MSTVNAVPAMSNRDTQNPVTSVASMGSAWVRAIEAGGMSVVDDSPITNPTALHATRNLLLVGCSTYLQARLAYPAAMTVSTAPALKAFGRRGDAGTWCLLKNRSKSMTATLSADPTDLTNGTLKFTTADMDDSTWDLQGCDQVMFGVEVALAGTGANVADAFVEVRTF